MAKKKYDVTYLCSEKNGEENMQMEEELELALQRVVNEKQYKYIPQLEQVLTLAQQKERILATQILGGLTNSLMG